jgi:hypothetical protein
MLIDRACPDGGWNAGNGIVLGTALAPHIDTTAIAVLALKEYENPVVLQGLKWLTQACRQCSSAYSLAWSALACLSHKDQAAEICIERLCATLSLNRAFNFETLSLSVIAIKAAGGNANPFQVLI